MNDLFKSRQRLRASWVAGLCTIALLPKLQGCQQSEADVSLPYVEAEINQPAQRRVRLFWQDRADAMLKWADLYSGSEWKLTPAAVEGFPKFDPKRQNLVQMDSIDGTLLVGVRDDDDGKFQSGWVAIDSGIRGDSHGDHVDWSYHSNPSVAKTKLDAEQGNPAHLYVYNREFFLANDAINGFTQLSPADLQGTTPTPFGRFRRGGGNHITMAVVDGRVCYSTWIDGEGENRGRVDVVNLTDAGHPERAYSLYLKTGVLHGATANSGRVFFAPAEGICWIDADRETRQSGKSLSVNYLSLGTDPETEKPLRTGSFLNHREWILFTTGRADASALCLVKADAPEPSVVKVPLPTRDGLSLVSPEAVLTSTGKRYAFLFQDRKDGTAVEKLSIVDLDPNGDRDFSDAKLTKEIPVGASQVEGHHGHHSICFDADGTVACFTNPGDGSIWVLSLSELEIVAKLDIGGKPSAITAMGGVVVDH